MRHPTGIKEAKQSSRLREEEEEGVMVKGCELCNFPAMIYCESDQANLCCDCDSKVHSANFLVAKHLRTLLCNACHSPTPWTASGSMLGPAVSVCRSCVHSCSNMEEIGGDDDDDDDGEDDIDDDDDDDEDEDETDDETEDNGGDDDDEDEENQVVPWSSTPPPPVLISSSTSEEESSCRFCNSGECVTDSKTAVSLNRMREIADFSSVSSQGCSSSQPISIRNVSLSKESASLSLIGLQKDHNRTETSGSGSKAVIDALKRLQQQSRVAGEDKSRTVLGICKLSKASGVGDGD